TISDNVMADTVTNGGGLHIANRYDGVNVSLGTAVSGTITAARNTLIRAGNSDYNWNFGVGAIWFDGARDQVNANIQISDTDILDSSYEAIQSIEGSGVTGVTLTNVNIDGAGTYAVQAQANASMKFVNVKAKNIAQSAKPVYNCLGTGLQITDGGGNSGWNTGQVCPGSWPAPVWTNSGVPTGGGSTPLPTTTTSTAPTTAPPTTTPPTTPSATPTTAPVNLAKGHTATASSTVQTYTAANAVDGNASTYWESASNAFPQTLTVDLGAAHSVGKVTLKLPPVTDWGSRTETLSVLGSTDNSTWSTLKSSTGVTLNAASGNTATLTFTAANARYVRLSITANTGWTAGQISELEVYAS
ncbi:MAG: hypothetical protein QOF98_1976, partial [Streptomyces sp.]|nr:hypothetical protein [Streptomyces sp.]